MTEIDLTRLQNAITQISLDGYIEVVRLEPKDEFVIADLADKTMSVGVLAIYSRKVINIDKPITVASESLVKVIKNLFKYTPIANIEVTDTDIVITSQDTQYVIKQRTDEILRPQLKVKELKLGSLPEYEGKKILAELTVKSDALSIIKSDEDAIQIIGNDGKFTIKFNYEGGETSKSFATNSIKEDFEMYVSYDIFSKIFDVLSGDVVIRVLKGEYKQLQIGKVDKDSVISFIMIERAV